MARFLSPSVCSRRVPLSSRKTACSSSPSMFSRNPNRRQSVSGRTVPRYTALPTNSRRTMVPPASLIPNCGWLSLSLPASALIPDTGPTSRLFKAADHTFCEGSEGLETANGCPALRRQNHRREAPWPRRALVLRLVVPKHCPGIRLPKLSRPPRTFAAIPVAPGRGIVG